MKILLFYHLKHSQMSNKLVSLTSKWARPLLSILSCSMLSAQARHSTAIMTPTEKDIRHSSEIYFCGYLFLLTFYWRTKNLCWIFDGICYLHSRQSYASHKVFSHENIFHLHLTWVNSTNMAGLRYPSWLR